MTMRNLLRAAFAAALLLAPSAGFAQSNPGTSPLSLVKGGTQTALTDPGADRVAFWDESAGTGGAFGWLTLSGCSITGTVLTCSGGGSLTEWTAASASGPASLYFSEDTDNGTNKITVTAPSSLSGDFTVTLPAADVAISTFAATFLDDAAATNVRTTLGIGTGDSPQFTGIELGNASDTTLTRTGAGAVAVEGVGVALNSTSLTHTASTYEIGAASDTTLARVSAGVASIEGSNILTAATGQPLDSDLTTIAGLTATTDNFLQAKSSAWASRTPTQVTADLIAFVGDSGSGGSKGLVPAPTTGDATKFLKGDGTWTAIPGGGDALTTNPLSQFAATTSAQLAGVISDETGSGALVFGTAPQLSTIELGHASDTTIARASAGNLTVEGNALYRAGGTDVALADGGTGASLTDPNADRIMFWDDSAGAVDWLTAAAPLTITTTTIDCDAATTSADGCSELATSAETETGTDTGRTVTPAGLLAAISGKHTIAMPAKAWTAETTTGCAAGSTELGNGIMQSTYDCDGAGSLQEGIQFTIPIMPKSWDEGTVTVQISWTNASGTGDVLWLVSCAAISNDDVMNASFGSEVTITDSVTAAADLMITPVSSAVTCSGTPAEGDMIVVRIQRDGDNASDTLNSVDARFLGADLFYNINAFTDD